MCFSGFPVIFSICFVYDGQFIVFIMVLQHMIHIYAFWSLGCSQPWKGFCQWNFVSYCSVKLADYSISVKVRIFVSLLPSSRQDVAMCIKQYNQLQMFFLGKTKLYIICGLHTIKPAMASEGFMMVLAVLNSVTKLYLLPSL